MKENVIGCESAFVTATEASCGRTGFVRVVSCSATSERAPRNFCELGDVGLPRRQGMHGPVEDVF